MNQVISVSYDPSVSGLKGNIGEIVEVAGGAAAWVKFGTAITDWRAFPGTSGGGLSDGVTIQGDGSSGSKFASIPASGANAGSMSAADFSKLAALPSADWYDQQEKFLRPLLPSLTQFERLKVGNAQSGNVTLPGGYADGGTVGGSLKTNSGAPLPLQTGSAFQTLKTVPWALSMRVKFAAIAAGDSSLAGFGNGSAFTMFGTNQATDGTKFVFFTADGGGQTNLPSSMTADTNWHTVAMTFDLSTVTVYVDGVSVFTTAVITHLPTVATFVAPYGLNGGSGGGLTFMSRAIYGCIDP